MKFSKYFFIMSKPASQYIKDQQDQVKKSLPFDDKKDFENAARGLRRRLSPNVITNSTEDVVWDNDSYKFLEEEVPYTANPSLWRQSRLTFSTDCLKFTQKSTRCAGSTSQIQPS